MKRVLRSFSFQLNRHSDINYFIENKSAYLDLINAQGTSNDSRHNQEKRLISLIDGFGSSLYGSMHGTFRKEGFRLDDGNSTDAALIQQMLDCNMHLGHSVSKFNRKMASFIWGEREGIHIIDLEKTLYYMRKAIAAAREIAAAGANVLFVAQRPLFERLTYEVAVESGHFYVNGPWTPGLVRNRQQLLGSEKYQPDLVVVLDYASNPLPVVEADQQLIPTIAVCDSDANPDCVTYPIPANDDAYESVDLVVRLLQRAVIQGSQQFRSKKASK